MKKAAFHNLGCRVNEYETEAMRQQLLRSGYEIVPFDERADVYVVNTCTVTALADRKSRQMLHRAKQQNPDAVVVACGCYVQDAKEELLRDAAVDLALGNAEKEHLTEYLERYLEEHENCPVQDIAAVKEYGHLAIDRPSERTRAFVKIQDGCNQFCAYCRIPYVRGRIRSRSEAEILEEVQRLTEEGCREIVLTGIHISSYGLDFSEDPDAVPPGPSGQRAFDVPRTNGHLIHLLRAISQIPEIGRIRLGSLEVRLITKEFVQRIAALPNLCPQFHLSLQSGSDRTLARMNRKYTTEEYRRSVELLRTYFTDPAITTDIIVGFPGEDASEFAETLRFAEQIGFAKIHIFRYSPREGTAACSMPDQVSGELKTARARALSALEKQMRFSYLNRIAPYPMEVLFEEAEDGVFRGHTEQGMPVRCRTDADLSNRLVMIPCAEVDEEGNLTACPDACTIPEAGV